MNMKYTLCTDLDRTLLPNGPQASDEQAIPLLSLLVEQQHLRLIYVSGRNHDLILDAIDQYALPIPEMAITDVGTRIYHINQETLSWHEDSDWQRYLGIAWDINKLDTIKHKLNQHAGLHIQEPEKQSRLKLSYYLDMQYYDIGIEQEIEQLCNDAGIRCNIVKSHDETTDTGLLDILPYNASKYHAIRFLMDKHSISEKEILFSGDSGNDMEVLVSEIPAILVKNAQDSVKLQAQQLANAKQHSQQLYIAEGDFCGLNGNYSSGILEGLAYYHQEFERLVGLYIKDTE